MSDLVYLVADKSIEAAVTALHSRHRALGIRPVEPEVVVHPRRDPGVFREGVDFLRPLRSVYERALILLDAAWDGAPADIEAELNRDLSGAGLGDWARAIVIHPELEVWVWSDSPHVDEALGWAGRDPALRPWLAAQGLWAEGAVKPADPKAAVQAALWEVRKPRSSSIYRALASTVSVERCQDRSFQRLRETLREWFGRETTFEETVR